MKVLMITPRVDMEHDIFGFIHSWVDKLSEKVDKLDVITFKTGNTNLRDNVEVYSAYSKNQLGKLIKLNTLLWTLTRKADVVFTHMYPWLPIVAAPYVKVFRKPLVAWNAHGTINLYKRISLGLVDKVVTSSESGFDIKTPKKVVINQGIDTTKFKPSTKKSTNDTFKIVTAGRVGKAKGYDVVIKAISILSQEKKRDVELQIVGPIHDNKHYQDLLRLIKGMSSDDRVEFTKSIPFGEIIKYYSGADVYVSASTTGSLDKTTLEAMACELPVVVCNEAFLDIFDDEMRDKCFFKKDDVQGLVNKIEHFMNNDEEELRKRLRNIVVENHSIESLANKLVDVFKGIKK